MSNRTYALILNYNSAGDTIKLFEQLKDLDICIFILDNASSAFDLELLKSAIPENHLILNEYNLGYAAGNNVGIRIALENNADYIWILNPDIRIKKYTLKVLLDTIKKEPNIAAVGPRIVSRANPNIIFSDGGTISYDKRCHADHQHYGANIKEHPAEINFKPDYLDGSCILLNSSALKELGLLPEFYFLYFEETHWCVNASKNGWKLVVNQHALAHNSKIPPNETYSYYTFRNRLLFAKKFHHKPPQVFYYYAKLLINQTYKRIFHIEHPPFLKLRIKAFFNALLTRR